MRRPTADGSRKTGGVPNILRTNESPQRLVAEDDWTSQSAPRISAKE
jgi:hypothetical protein